MDRLEALLAGHEIRSLKSRYFRGVDTQDWDLFRSTFTDDALFDFTSAAVREGGTGVPAQGADGFVTAIRAQLEGVQTVHHGLSPEIDIDTPESARGVWPMQDRLFLPAPREDFPFTRMHGMGHYHERYRKEGGRWRICSTRLVRTKVETWR